jgi:hypothetical protein
MVLLNLLLSKFYHLWLGGSNKYKKSGSSTAAVFEALSVTHV